MPKRRAAAAPTNEPPPKRHLTRARTKPVRTAAKKWMGVSIRGAANRDDPNQSSNPFKAHEKGLKHGRGRLVALVQEVMAKQRAEARGESVEADTEVRDETSEADTPGRVPLDDTPGEERGEFVTEEELDEFEAAFGGDEAGLEEEEENYEEETVEEQSEEQEDVEANTLPEERPWPSPPASPIPETRTTVLDTHDEGLTPLHSIYLRLQNPWSPFLACAEEESIERITRLGHRVAKSGWSYAQLEEQAKLCGDAEDSEDLAGGLREWAEGLESECWQCVEETIRLGVESAGGLGAWGMWASDLDELDKEVDEAVGDLGGESEAECEGREQETENEADDVEDWNGANYLEEGGDQVGGVADDYDEDEEDPNEYLVDEWAELEQEHAGVYIYGEDVLVTEAR